MTTTLLLWLSKIKMGNVELINTSDFAELVLRLLLNMGVVLLLVRWLYYGTTRRKDYLFTYILISLIVFMLCHMLNNVKIELGFALGLFAIFGILRYRTDQIPIKEMTYLFLVIGVSVLNAVANKKISVAEQLFTNTVLVLVVYGMEKIWLLRHESAKVIIYEKIHLIKAGKREELLADLQERTGIEKINRVDIGKIDFLRDTCRLIIYYYEKGNEINRADQLEAGSGDGD
ncbi:MAG: DUF4956 domain-containing protein [Breznakibacter sp.]